MWNNTTSYNHKIERLCVYHRDLFSQIKNQFEKGQNGEVQLEKSTLAMIMN